MEYLFIFWLKWELAWKWMVLPWISIFVGNGRKFRISGAHVYVMSSIVICVRFWHWKLTNLLLKMGQSWPNKQLFVSIVFFISLILGWRRSVSFSDFRSLFWNKRVLSFDNKAKVLLYMNVNPWGVIVHVTKADLERV